MESRQWCDTMHWNDVMHDLRWLYSKRDIIMDFFHLSKNIWARMKVQLFRGRNQNSQQYRVQHQDRIECSLNDGFKGFSDKHQGLAITGKSTMLLPKQIQGKDQGFDWNYKLRSTIRFRHGPTHSIYKRFSQPRLGKQIILAPLLQHKT